MAATAYGAMRRKRWGLNLAMLIFTANAAGDAVRGFMGDMLEGAIGVVVAGLILYALSCPQIRSVFT